MVHQDQGNYEEAVVKYNQSLKLKEELGNKSGIARTLHQLGMVHAVKKEYPFALQAYLRAYSIFTELHSPHSQLTEKEISELRNELGDQEFNALSDKLKE